MLALSYARTGISGDVFRRVVAARAEAADPGAAPVTDRTGPMENGIILPHFNPFAIEIGGFGIRWYALAYIAGLLLGYYLLRREARQPGAPLGQAQLDALLNYVLIGIILGGRLGYVLFYNAGFYLANPAEILMIWQGGMSFHGGLLGVTMAMLLFAHRHQVPVLQISDRVAMVAPIGLFLGRLSNFINAELYGRVTDLPWAMIFPNSDGLPRHPSQLYEAGLEGLGIGIVMLFGARRGWLAHHGRMTACLLVGYGLARYLVEFVREPDAHLGQLAGFMTMGQLLCLPMLAGGLYLLTRERRKAKP